MIAFTTLDAPACILPMANIDTDQIIPARFMKRPRSDGGYGKWLLHDFRFNAEGKEIADFPLNTSAGKVAEIIIAGENFGCGSSREPAVYALADYGIRCVIAPSFGDIFSSNCIRNGVLPASISAAALEQLFHSAHIANGGKIHIDLEAQKIVAGNISVDFSIASQWKTRLLNGWDDIDMTRSYADAIKTFAQDFETQNPWALPRG